MTVTFITFASSLAGAGKAGQPRRRCCGHHGYLLAYHAAPIGVMVSAMGMVRNCFVRTFSSWTERRWSG